MMMMPSIFGGNLFNDDWMDFSFPDIDKELYGLSLIHICHGKIGACDLCVCTKL